MYLHVSVYLFMTNSMDKQIGGSHYKDMAIQPLEYSMSNGLNACEHSIIKYVSRHGAKGGREDLEKAQDMLQKLIEFSYPEEKEKHPYQGMLYTLETNEDIHKEWSKENQ